MKVIRQIKSYFVKIRQIVNIWQLKRAGVIFLSPPPIIYGKLYTHKHKSASIIISLLLLEVDLIQIRFLEIYMRFLMQKERIV